MENGFLLIADFKRHLQEGICWWGPGDGCTPAARYRGNFVPLSPNMKENIFLASSGFQYTNWNRPWLKSKCLHKVGNVDLDHDGCNPTGSYGKIDFDYRGNPILKKNWRFPPVGNLLQLSKFYISMIVFCERQTVNWGVERIKGKHCFWRNESLKTDCNQN